jgi:hypothetical protein
MPYRRVKAIPLVGVGYQNDAKMSFNIISFEFLH